MIPFRKPRRALGAPLALAFVLVGGACTVDDVPGPPSGAPTLAAMADRLGTDVMELIRRGYVPGRSGEIVVVPEPWNVLGQWNNGFRGPGDPRTTHATPWSYHARVPIVLWGPGYVRPGVVSDRSVDVADIAPTVADLLGFDFHAPAGEPLRESLIPSSRGPDPPRLIVTIAYDGGGWNLLERWPDAWPEVRRLASTGTVYTNATIGSAPSVTAPVHLNMGTGAYPETHGIPENTARLPDGTVSEIFFHEADPRLVEAPTVADLWDRANANRPWVGLVGFESWHLGMIGSGARIRGGDRDVAVLWERELNWFRTNEEVYRFPAQLPTEADLASFVDELDARDGARDGYWMGNSLSNSFFLPGTPAFVELQGEVVSQILRYEGVGADGLTDLLAVELKSSDYGGHIWNMEAREAEAVLRAQDALVGDLLDELDRRVGRGRYVVILTADHGQTALPETTGGLRVDRYRMEEDIEAYFGADIVEDGGVHPSEIFLKMDTVRAEGISVEAVARFVGAYRYRDGLPDGLDPASVPSDVLDSPVIAAALPGAYLTSLSASDIDRLGASEWPEGDLSSPPGYQVLLE